MVYTICIGSNVDGKNNLSFARKRLSKMFPDICYSEEEKTEPLFFRKADPFFNQLAMFSSNIEYAELTIKLKAIEREAGRKIGDKECEIIKLDIDILSCNDTIYRPEEMYRDYIVRGLRSLNRHNNPKNIE